ncbi:MAG: sigma 54-interacting transcriptional regulator, partial [Deltaproteobacteria bacterium]|nr:sigma 54-interacting transcriptional regulator [Deltaproteobacteria bacterium]
VVAVDVRLIVATNKDLLALTVSGRFREDLYYRLNVVNLNLPPLRERKEDIPLLAQHFLEKFSALNHKSVKGFTPQTMDHLIRHDWPGNVRELMNAIERGVVLSRSEYLDDQVLPMLPASPAPSSSAVIVNPSAITDETKLLRPSVSACHTVIVNPSAEATETLPLTAVEKATILSALASSDGNKSLASRKLGITRKTLHKKLKEYGVMP